MSQLYIIPRLVQPDPTVTQILQRSGVTHLNANKLHEIWPYIGVGSKVLVELDETTMAILLRYSDTLLDTMPFVITGFPGAHYSPEWNMQSGHVTPMRYSDFEAQLLKSGHQANDTSEVSSRAPLDVEPPSIREARTRPQMVRKPQQSRTADAEGELDDFELED